ncbi:hypothetical protein L2719_08300 [Shewanella schlegeliana]|uniref:Cytochrome oxidase assembly protein n=1 Tax=Shewanella schlegeliana TaxID=190308 RepID=A0ABS1T569_9GAMM|nr:hypothetical protein [Shewanella schlegeliana]MBL4914646.1 hypothetical protein [Shewanella schlegeliana]MCL1109538.1 hypothetical protein [Shewanella schlegeliana]GIU29607.1 hypothetical protein TUM4433_19060 [Shewanella schlegeliana]
MNSPKKNGNKTLILLLLAFILPVVAAKLVLSFDLYNGGATNQGQLLATDVSYQSLKMDNPKPHEWQLVYLLPRHCNAVCQDRLYILQQSHTALGRNQNRVHTIVMVDEHSDTSALADFNVITATPSQQLSQMLDQQQLVIIDPLGSLVMSYPVAEGHQAQIMQGKALVSDLRKLLKLSRIG